MTKAPKTRPAPTAPLLESAPAIPAAEPPSQHEDDPTIGMVHVRDVYAAQALSAIVCGIVTRGGIAALESTLQDGTIFPLVFRLADDALLAREA